MRRLYNLAGTSTAGQHDWPHGCPRRASCRSTTARSGRRRHCRPPLGPRSRLLVTRCARATSTSAASTSRATTARSRSSPASTTRPGRLVRRRSRVLRTGSRPAVRTVVCYRYAGRPAARSARFAQIFPDGERHRALGDGGGHQRRRRAVRRRSSAAAGRPTLGATADPEAARARARARPTRRRDAGRTPAAMVRVRVRPQPLLGSGAAEPLPHATGSDPARGGGAEARPGPSSSPSPARASSPPAPLRPARASPPGRALASRWQRDGDAAVTQPGAQVAPAAGRARELAVTVKRIPVGRRRSQHHGASRSRGSARQTRSAARVASAARSGRRRYA